MNLREASTHIGDTVVYRPVGQSAEVGVIMSVSRTHVFVRYGDEAWSKATPCEFLVLAEVRVNE